MLQSSHRRHHPRKAARSKPFNEALSLIGKKAHGLDGPGTVKQKRHGLRRLVGRKPSPHFSMLTIALLLLAALLFWAMYRAVNWFEKI